MKNYYELDDKDMQKYIGEFNKTRYAKNINEYRFCLIMALVFLPILSAFLGEFASNEIISNLIALIESAWGLVLLTFIVLSVVLSYARMRYLKAKHKIEY